MKAKTAAKAINKFNKTGKENVISKSILKPVFDQLVKAGYKPPFKIKKAQDWQWDNDDDPREDSPDFGENEFEDEDEEDKEKKKKDKKKGS